MMAMAMMMGIGVLDAKGRISISHKNQSVWNIDTRFTTSCLLGQDLSIAIQLKGVASAVGSQKRRRNRRFRRAGAVGYIHVREAVNPILEVGWEEWGGDDRYRSRWIKVSYRHRHVHAKLKLTRKQNRC